MSGKVEKVATNVPQFNGTSDEISKIIGAILVREGVVDQQTLSAAQRSIEKTNSDKTLFQTLADEGWITRTHFLDCIRKCQPDLPLGTLLTELGLISRARLDQMLHYQAHDYYQFKLGELLVRNFRFSAHSRRGGSNCCRLYRPYESAVENRSSSHAVKRYYPGDVVQDDD